MLLASLLFAGCATKPAAEPPRPAQDDAAQAVEQARNTPLSARRAELYLQALLLYHERGELDKARDVLRQFSATAAQGESLAAMLSDARRFQLQALTLELALATHDEAEVERLANALRPTNAAQQAHAERLRTRALMAARNHAAAALEMMAAAPRLLAAGEVDKPAFAGAIWRHLSKLSPLLLGRLAKDASGTVASWLKLAGELNTALTSRQRAAIWHRWAGANRSHPAARLQPPGIAEAARAPRNIALLIPLSGDIAAAAEAIRDGFLAAYLNSTETQSSAAQGVRLYDTGAMAVAEAYRRAAADGADLIVGPLEKSAVGEMTALAPTLPVLALNTLDRQREGIYQIGLAVEDDAAAVAAGLIASGAERVVVFEGQRRWSKRALERFGAELAGAEVVAVARLDGIANAAEVAGEALGIVDSNNRRAELSRMLGEELEFVPRRRDDVDAVVAFLDSAQLTALKPALDFHYAGDLPVFAPSQAVQGVSWRRMNGLRVCDIPWRLHRPPLRRAASAFAAGGSAFFALGVDAFRIANQLPRMTDYGETLAGATGMLTLGEDGRIHRQLAWGKVVGGRLIAVPAP